MKAGDAGDEPAKYKAKSMMTANELEFLNRLEQAVPEMRFHAQVAMGSLVEPNVSCRESGKEYMSLRGRFSQNMIDFVAQDRSTGDVVAIIELDDKTHDREKDAKRDAITSSAGYATVRWQSKSKPDAAEIRSKLLALAKPAAVQPKK